MPLTKTIFLRGLSPGHDKNYTSVMVYDTSVVATRNPLRGSMTSRSLGKLPATYRTVRRRLTVWRFLLLYS